jgi:D-threo-aldose 1-dehydrogenase
MATATAIARIGFGGASIGGLHAAVSEEGARATLEAAWAGGIRTFDTAPLYGSGLSEQRLGEFLARKPRADYRISTKVGRVLVPSRGLDASGSLAQFAGALPFDAVFDFSADGIRRSLESSLQRLRLDYLDVAFIHDPDEHMDQALRESYPALQRLRDEGLVREIGVGMNYSAPLTRFVRETDIDVILIAGRYTLLDRDAAQELLPLCRKRNVRAVAAGVFNSGILAQNFPGDDARFHYHRVDAGTLKRAREIAAVCDRYGAPLPTVALAFTLQHPAVESIVLGMRSPQQVRANLANARIEVPDQLWPELAAHGVVLA